VGGGGHRAHRARLAHAPGGDPLANTAGNLLRSAGIAAGLFLLRAGSARATPAGLGLAAASGAIASGVGYSLWYAVVPRLGATRSAAVQLSVPVLAALAAVALLGEPLTGRLVLAGGAILVGIALAILGRARPVPLPR
jgi:drug/metabolite transporter (DMT)-like permease